MKITFHKELIGSFFDTETYTIDTERPFGGYKEGDLLCCITPFFDVPLTLEIAIEKGGDVRFRKWDWNGEGNRYLHTHEKPAHNCRPGEIPFNPTAEQIDTVNGLFSGRIKFEGLKLPVGATLQKLCPIDVSAEEKKIGKRIYLA